MTDVTALDTWIEKDVRERYAGRVLALSEKVLVRWLMLIEHGRSRNHTYSQPDLFLAATALEHDLTLVTRNTRDFADVPALQVFNPWTSNP